MPNIQITKVLAEDIESLQAIARKTFYETFASSNSEEDMARYLKKSFSLEKLSAELNDRYSEFYFAKIEDRIVGYLKINSRESQTEPHDPEAVEIERIYVTSEFHGKKVGQLLYDKVLQIARRQNASAIWLGVWEKNPRAIRFYEKNGFIEFDTHRFQLGKDIQTDILMKLPLSK